MPVTRGARPGARWTVVPGTRAWSSTKVEWGAARDVVFGKVWSDGGLGRKERRLTSLTCTAVVGASGALEVHLDAAVRSGDLTLEELGHWVLHLAFYAGWPVASGAYIAWRSLAARQAEA